MRTAILIGLTVVCALAMLWLVLKTGPTNESPPEEHLREAEAPQASASRRARSVEQPKTPPAPPLAAQNEQHAAATGIPPIVDIRKAIEDERDFLIEQLRVSGSGVAAWTQDAQRLLGRAVAAMADGALRSSEVECYEAGCVLTVAYSEKVVAEDVRMEFSQIIDHAAWSPSTILAVHPDERTSEIILYAPGAEIPRLPNAM